ncbi:hypothetical protein JB92DRAFT_3116148 [Gautieria morchelliformis]|nr:hypothetical protein JB92DRAFT_3116148 [Gautieria morchelliformis]
MVLVTHWEWPKLEGTDWEADGLVNRLGMANFGSQEWDRHLEDIELKVNSWGRLDLEDIELELNGGDLGGHSFGPEWGVYGLGCLDWGAVDCSRPDWGAQIREWAAGKACPGRQLDESSLFIAMASVVACINISPKPSAKRPERTFGFIRRPILFPVNITSRSPKWRDIVEREVLPTA